MRYLIAHEDARDTIEGIEKWWLPQSPEYGIADIAMALRRLESRNLIHVWRAPSAKPVYGRRAPDSGPLREYLRDLQ